MPCIDPKLVRPRRDWALLLADPRKTELASGLVLPDITTKAERVTEFVGTVIRLGTKDKLKNVPINEGDKVVFRGFLKYASPIEHDEVWEDGSRKEYFLMDAGDILAVTDGTSDIGIYSSRPAQFSVESVGEDGSVKMR